LKQGTILRETPRSNYKRVLSNRSLFTLWLAQTISQTGDYAFNVALLWYVLQSTGSLFLVGLTQAFVAMPVALIGPLAGVYVDRLNRKNVMIASALFQGAVVAVFASLFITGKLEFPMLLSLVFLLFSGQQFFISALNAYVPRAVNKDALGAANSLFSLSNVSNMFMGYVIGGLVLAILGVSVIVAYDCITFFVAAGLLFTISGLYGRPTVDTLKKSVCLGASFISDFKSGLDYIRSSKLLLEIMAVGTVLTFFADGLIALLPAYAKQQLGGSSFTYGLVLAAAVVGGMIGSVAFGKLESRRFIGKIFIFCTLLSGLATLTLGLNSNATIAIFAAILMGGSYFVANLCVQVFLQATVPGQILGRVYTVFFGILGVFAPVGALMSGFFAGYSNPGFVYTMYGGFVLVAGVLMLITFAKLKTAHY